MGLVNCVPRKHLAAFDATTGKPTDWDPSVNGLGVSDILLSGGSIYVAGAFSEVGGQPRSNLAALDPVTGAATGWVADTDGPMRKLAIAGNRLFASGYFTMIGTTPRKYLAAFGLPTGQLDALDLNVNSEPLELTPYGDTLFIGGDFTSVGGLPRYNVAAVDAAAGTVLDWAPSVDNAVQAIAVKDEAVYLGGVFHSIDGLPRERLGAVSASTGAATSWVADAANLNPFTTRVYDLALVDSTLYVAGSMDSIAGVSRAGLAALDAATGRVLDWNPSFGGATWTYPPEPGVIWRLAVDQGTLYAGGRFGWVETSPVGMLAAYVLTPGPDPPHHPTVVSLAPPAPNPAQVGTTLRFSLPSTAVVDLTVFDVHGRRVASPVPHQPKPAGDHEVSIRTSDWPAGFYFCRLEVAGMVATRKFVVLK